MAISPALPFKEWRHAVDRRLLQIYCIDIEDAGFDDTYLTEHWQSNTMPSDFVDWFGNNYDLETISDYRHRLIGASI